MDPLGIEKASATVAAAVPEVSKIATDAETSLAVDLAGVEKTLESSLGNAIAAFADGVTQILSGVDRLDGGSITVSPITISFSFPRKDAK